MERKNTVHMVYLKDLLFAALFRWKRTLCVALVLAFILGGFTAVTGLSSMKKSENDALAQQTATESYQTEKSRLEKHVDVLKKGLAGQQSYIAESLFMALDAFNFYESSLRLYVDTGYQILPEVTYQNPNQTPAVLSAYYNELIQKEHLEKMGNFIDAEAQYVSELLSTTITNETNSLLIRVRCSTAEGAQSLTDYLAQQIEPIQKAISKDLCEHTATVSVTPALPRMDTNIADAQKNAVDRAISLENALQNAEKKLQNLTPPAQTTTNLRSVLKDTVIFFVIGAVLGGVVMTLFFMAAHIVGEKVYSAQLLTERTGVKVLGCITGKPGKTRLDRWLRKLEGRNVYPAEAQTQLLAANLQSRCVDAAPLLAVCDGTDSCKTIAEALQAALPQLQISTRGSLLTDPAAIAALSQSKAVLLLAQCEHTRYADVEKQAKFITDCGKDLVGCILLDG